MKAQPTIQGRVREMLAPRLYGRGTRKVRMLQTHTSWVFLTGRRAYKVKKPVNFGFLDYTDLSAREFFCREEFRLNQRLSPDIYLRVLPIRESRGRLRLGGRGKVVDWCLEMKELPQDAMMTERLKSGEVTHEHLDEIARTIARFHSEAERGREISRYGSSEIIKLNWDENFAQTMEFRGRTITYPAFDLVKAKVEEFIRAHRGLFRSRRQGGFVRKCHGDLHSRNVFINSGVHIFDCIEFNPRFSCSDTASEIAFMKMDLDFHGRRDLAGYFIERYLVHSGDKGMLRLLDFYECYRAYVRGKVTSFNLNDPGMPAEDKARARDTARRYFKLSESSAARLERPARLVLMLGLPGTGKTWLAERLADRLEAFHFNSDSIRKQLAGVPIRGRRADNLDKNLYARALSVRTYRELERRTRTFLRVGQTVIADATFLHPDSRARFTRLAERVGAPWLMVQTDCPEKTIRSRMRRRARRDGVSEADLPVYHRMKGNFDPPERGPHLVRVDTRRPVNRSLARIERALLRL